MEFPHSFCNSAWGIHNAWKMVRVIKLSATTLLTPSVFTYNNPNVTPLAAIKEPPATFVRIPLILTRPPMYSKIREEGLVTTTDQSPTKVVEPILTEWIPWWTWSLLAKEGEFNFHWYLVQKLDFNFFFSIDVVNCCLCRNWHFRKWIVVCFTFFFFFFL